MPMQSFEIERPAHSLLGNTPFGRKEYDVGPTVFKLCCQEQRLILEPEEAVLQTTTPCASTTRRMPYGELGQVQHTTSCGCCHNFSSNLNSLGQAEAEPLSPGFGCSGQLVEEIVNELKARMKARGDTGNIQRAEEALAMIHKLSKRSDHQAAKIDAILAHLSVPIPQEMVEMPVSTVPLPVFDSREYDVTPTCAVLCSCGIARTTLQLGPEEAVLQVTDCCSSIRSRRPYGELGVVDEATCCQCCVYGSTQLGAISPGCGCSNELVHEIVEELKKRMKARGDTGNIQRQEETNLLVREVLLKVMNEDAKVDVILRHLDIAVPRPPQEAMNEGN